MARGVVKDFVIEGVTSGDRESTPDRSAAFFLSLATIRMVLDVFFVPALVLGLVARSCTHIRSS